MADKITKEDIFEGDIFAEANKGIEDFEKSLMRVLKTTKDVGQGINDALKTKRDKLVSINPNDSKALKELNDELKKSQALQKIAIDLKIKEQKLQQEVIASISKERKELEAASKEVEKKAQQSRKLAQAQEKLNSVYEQNKRQLKSVSDRYKELVSREKEGTTTGRLLKAEFDRLDKSVRKAEESVGQFNRSVGNYKNAIKDALSNTGLFSGKLGGLINSLKAVRDAQDKTATGAKALGNAFKLTGIGLVLVALAALKTAFDAAAEFTATVAEKVEIASAALKGFTLGAFDGSVAFSNYAKTLIAYRKELINLQVSLQKVTLDQQDFIEISNDITISFEQRNAALDEAIKLGDEKAKKETQIAKNALDLVDAEIAAIQKANGGREVEISFLQKREEALLNFNEAQDKEDDLIRQNAELRRKRNSDEASAQIELLRSKKLNAASESDILEKRLADERNQIEERRKINKELLAVNAATVNEEIKIFKNKIGIQFNANKLINEQDAIALKARLDALRTLEGNGLGANDLELLSKIIKQAKDDLKAFNDEKAKLDDEETKRKIRVAEIQKEIDIANLKDDIETKTDALDAIKEAEEDNLDKTLEGFGVFSEKRKKLRELQRKNERIQVQALFEDQVDLLNKEAELAKENVDKEIKDKVVAAEEKRKIDAQLQNDLARLNGDVLASRIEQGEREIEEEKKIAKRKLDVALEYGNKILDEVEKNLEAQSEKRNDAIEKELDQREKQIDTQKNLAEKGLNNTLAFEEEQKAKLELAREQEKEKEIKRQKAFAFLKLLSGYAEKDPTTALSKALIDIAIATAVQGAFKDGVEGLQGEGTETSDSILARLSKGESVVTAKATKEHSGLPTALNEGKVDEYFEKNYLPKYVMNGNLESTSTASNFHNSALLHQIVGVNKRLESLEQTIASKREQTVQLDNLGNVIVSQVEKGFKQTTMYKTRKANI